MTVKEKTIVEGTTALAIMPVKTNKAQTAVEVKVLSVRPDGLILVRRGDVVASGYDIHTLEGETIPMHYPPRTQIVCLYGSNLSTADQLYKSKEHLLAVLGFEGFVVEN